MIMNRFLKAGILILLLTAVLTPLAATENDRWDISIAFIGPADAIYSSWGHVALIVDDKADGSSEYYDYGNFSFSQESFIRNFTMGRLYFLKDVSNTDLQLRYAEYLNRDVHIYKLNIAPERKLELINFLGTEILPENRVYLYDHFYDNCSTRIRDILNEASEGELYKAADRSSGTTLRQQLRRFTYHQPLLDWILNFPMKGNIDTDATVWDTMFLPKNLEKEVASLQLRQPDGSLKPFASEKIVYNTAKNRPVITDIPRPLWPLTFAAGLVIAGAALLFGRSRRFPAKLTAGLSAVLSFILAVLGTLVMFMACFTDHSFAYWNMNLLFVNPLMFIVFGFSIASLATGGKSAPKLEAVWRIPAAGCILSIILKLIPFCRQDNWSSILLVLPPALVLSGILRIMLTKTIFRIENRKK